ncbi:MAG: hypothetical protein K5897_05060 [Eubacterium sp.]|nr:hypothetical protein [Eubacterium sp.]
MGKEKKKTGPKLSVAEQHIQEGYALIRSHPLFGVLFKSLYPWTMVELPKGVEGSACVTPFGGITVCKNRNQTPEAWAYVFAHLLLHLGLGHVNPAKVSQGVEVRTWNVACDIYVTRFLRDIRFPGEPASAEVLHEFPGSMKDEKAIYEYLISHDGETEKYAILGTFGKGNCDIRNLEEIWTTKTPWRLRTLSGYEAEFAAAVQSSVRSVLREASSTASENPDTPAHRAASWFINSYPLLGGLAAHFKIIEDPVICQRQEIAVAAVDVSVGEIYVNPAANLSFEELKFVLAHEYLHAGLDHAGRRNGRDHELWNAACDYVINAWLREMHIGLMPQQGLLFDETLAGLSAEEIYDELARTIRTAKKLMTFRGYGKGDILGSGQPGQVLSGGAVSMEEYCKNALMQGLEYQVSSGRGLVPAGLMEEIRALAMPPIPWDVELAKWFDDWFAPLEKHRTYARPSRRQASTPDIPRPRYILDESLTEGRTFGVVIDTSGSMSVRDIGIALGAIASYADAKDVPKMRVVFCDADAYDVGYLSPEEVAGRVEVQGRGGTVLQPGVDLLEAAKDFPKDGPILIITDGWIESDLTVKREHAFLIPKGHALPFRPRGKVFYYE